MLLPSPASIPLTLAPKCRAVRAAGMLAAAIAITALAGCDRGSTTPGMHAGITFPADADIHKSLDAAFAEDPDNTKARELVRLLGGEPGRLDYQVRRVVYRQGAFEAQYDVALRMGQDGADSLRELYATMVPADEAAKLPAKGLPDYERWLQGSAEALDKANPAQAAALRNSLAALGKCYRDRKRGDTVTLMEGLSALVSPARDGWYAEKVPSPRLRVLCLPS